MVCYELYPKPIVMLMTNDNIQLYPHDKLFYKCFVQFVPSFLSPNDFTILRFLLIPFVLYFLYEQNWPWSLGLFIVAALTDAIDGTLARMRKQITLWGTMADPIADKCLIGSVVLLFVAREINVWFAVVIVSIEFMIAAGAWYRKRRGVYSSANQYGKIKMLLQVTGVALLILAKLLGIELAVPFAVGTLSLAIVFAMVSLWTYGI